MNSYLPINNKMSPDSGFDTGLLKNINIQMLPLFSFHKRRGTQYEVSWIQKEIIYTLYYNSPAYIPQAFDYEVFEAIFSINQDKGLYNDFKITTSTIAVAMNKPLRNYSTRIISSLKRLGNVTYTLKSQDKFSPNQPSKLITFNLFTVSRCIKRVTYLNINPVFEAMFIQFKKLYNQISQKKLTPLSRRLIEVLICLKPKDNDHPSFSLQRVLVALPLVNKNTTNLIKTLNKNLDELIKIQIIKSYRCSMMMDMLKVEFSGTYPIRI